MNKPDIKELLTLVEESPVDETEPTKERKSKYNRSIKQFIVELGIVSGDKKVPVHKLVYEYYKWKSDFYSKASPREFGRVLAQHFKRHRTGTTRFYMLNEFCDLSKEALKESKRYYSKNFLKKKTKVEKESTQKGENAEPTT